MAHRVKYNDKKNDKSIYDKKMSEFRKIGSKFPKSIDSAEHPKPSDDPESFEHPKRVQRTPTRSEFCRRRNQ